jgi:hypothetical protein
MRPSSISGQTCDTSSRASGPQCRTSQRQTPAHERSYVYLSRLALVAGDEYQPAVRLQKIELPLRVRPRLGIQNDVDTGPVGPCANFIIPRASVIEHATSTNCQANVAFFRGPRGRENC